MDRQNIGADHVGLCDPLNTNNPVSVVDASIEDIIALVPSSENNITFVPRMIGSFIDLKLRIT